MVGLIIGTIGPDGPAVGELKNTVSSAAVALALPLLLFSVNIGAWSRLAGKATLSMLLAFASVVIVVAGGYFLIRDVIPEAWQLGGMAVGLYTGGTPNLAAIRTAPAVDADVYIAIHTYDTVIGMFYLLFTMSLAKPLFRLFLPKFERATADQRKSLDTSVTSAVEAENDGANVRTGHENAVVTYQRVGARRLGVDSFGAYPCAICSAVVGADTLLFARIRSNAAAVSAAAGSENMAVVEGASVCIASGAALAPINKMHV